MKGWMLLVGGLTVGSAFAQVPKIDQLAGRWLDAKDILNFPSVNNTHGAVRCGANLTEFYHGNFPPLSQAGSTAELTIDERPVAAQQLRWFPYQVVRKAKLEDGLALESVTRLAANRNEILILLTVKNEGQRSLRHEVAVTHKGGFRLCDVVWDWNNRAVPPGGFGVRLFPDHLVLVDSQGVGTTTVRAYSKPISLGMASAWNIDLKPGQSRKFQFSYVAGDEGPKPTPFDQAFKESKRDWESRWRDAFTPYNKRYSGWLPTLVTRDTKVRRVYYQAVMAMLQMERTTLRHTERCFVTAGPQWATTMEYFWDTSLFSTLYSWLAPREFRANIQRWLDVDEHAHYAIDYVSGRGVGPWYSANDLSLFTAAWNYATVRGDQGFLVRMRSHFGDWATYWKKRVPPGEFLADYGENENILKCGPQYIHMIPSLNGANVEMMRKDALIEAKFGDAAKAASLGADASDLAKHVLAMYQPGQGVWATKHRDGKTIVARHVYDYITIGQGMTSDLSPAIRREMTDFVNRELVVDGWIRAMSLSDDAASISDRPDHGPKGSYCGWPAMAALTMCEFEQFDDAVKLFQNCEKATWEGPLPQSIELVPTTGGYALRIAYRGGQDYNEPNGTAFAEAICRGLFGIDYDLDGNLVIRKASRGRPFSGELRNVPVKDTMVNVACGQRGIRVTGPAPEKATE